MVSQNFLENVTSVDRTTSQILNALLVEIFMYFGVAARRPIQNGDLKLVQSGCVVLGRFKMATWNCQNWNRKR